MSIASTHRELQGNMGHTNLPSERISAASGSAPRPAARHEPPGQRPAYDGQRRPRRHGPRQQLERAPASGMQRPLWIERWIGNDDAQLAAFRAIQHAVQPPWDLAKRARQGGGLAQDSQREVTRILDAEHPK